MTVTRIPTKITPDPIIEAAVEIRFKSSLSKDSIIPGFINAFIKDFPRYKEGTIPPFPGFLEDHLSKISLFNESFLVGFGSRVLVFGCVGGYKGWDKFSKVIYSNLEKVFSEKLVDGVERIGVRYINFFKGVSDLSSNINLQISFAGKENFSQMRGTQIRTEVGKEGLKIAFLLVDNARVNNNDGSILDIDSYSENLNLKSPKDIISKIEENKFEETNLFFTLIKDSFLAKYNPEYK